MNADRYISSLKRLYLVMLLLVFGVLYVYFQEYNKSEIVARSRLLQTLLAIEDVAQRQPSPTVVTEKDLARFSFSASIAYSNSKLAEGLGKIAANNPQLKETLEKSAKTLATSSVPLSDNIIQGASIDNIEPTRFSPRSNCEALALPGSDSHTTTVILTGAGLQMLKLSQIQLLVLSSSCNLPSSADSPSVVQSGPGSVKTLLLFRASAAESAGDWVVGVPSDAISTLSWPTIKFTLLQIPKMKIDPNQFLEGYSEAVKRYIKLDSVYTAIPRIDLEAEIFEEAERATGKFHSPNDLSGALDDISTYSSSFMTIGGVNASGIFFIQVAPCVLTAILFLMGSEPWLYKDVGSRAEILLAGCTALMPIAAVLGLFFVFADLQGFSFQLPFLESMTRLGIQLPHFLSGPWTIRQIFGLPPFLYLQLPSFAYANYYVAFAEVYFALFAIASTLAISIGLKIVSILSMLHRVSS